MGKPPAVDRNARTGESLADVLDRALELAEQIPRARAVPDHQLSRFVSVQGIWLLVGRGDAADLSASLDGRKEPAQRRHQLDGCELVRLAEPPLRAAAHEHQ